MISKELRVQIRHLFFVEHWKIGTIASELALHHDTVRLAIESDGFRRGPSLRMTLTDPYIEMIQETLRKHPRLRATRLLEMIRDRGYKGSASQLRRVVQDIRPAKREAFLRLQMIAGEQAQLDWAHFGEMIVGKAHRKLSCLVIVLCYSRVFWIEFFFDQGLENLLLGHAHAFEDWGGVPRTVVYDNMRTVVLERLGDAIRFHPQLMGLAGHYHFMARPCRPARGNEKGRVERLIHYVRHSFFAARSFSSLADLNRQALQWRDQVAHQRPWPDDDSRTVAQAFEEEKLRLLPLPAHRFETDLVKPVRSPKTIYVRFDLNDYSIPPSCVGKRLTLIASPTTIRILDGMSEVAHHQRSYDRHQCISDPAHIDVLVAEKRKALGATAKLRLAHAIPNIREFLDAAFNRGASVSRMTRQLILLLNEYGSAEVAAAVTESLQQRAPSIESITYVLQRRYRSRRRKMPQVDLSRHAHLENLAIETASLEVYDELTEDDDDKF